MASFIPYCRIVRIQHWYTCRCFLHPPGRSRAWRMAPEFIFVVLYQTKKEKKINEMGQGLTGFVGLEAIRRFLSVNVLLLGTLKPELTGNVSIRMIKGTIRSLTKQCVQHRDTCCREPDWWQVLLQWMRARHAVSLLHLIKLKFS